MADLPAGGASVHLHRTAKQVIDDFGGASVAAPTRLAEPRIVKRDQSAGPNMRVPHVPVFPAGHGAVIAIDVSAEMIERARSLNSGLSNVRFVHGDGVSLRPVDDASVDVCISYVVFQHIPDPDVTLDLQTVLDHTYDAADYGKYIYGEMPEPPLGDEDAAWAQGFVPPGGP